MLAQAAVGALVDVVALVERRAQAVPRRTAALEGARQVDALRQAAARRAPRRALVHVAAQVRRVVVLVAAGASVCVTTCYTAPTNLLDATSRKHIQDISQC